MSEVKFGKDARTFYSNAFGVMFTGADLRLQFGIETNPGSGDGSMEVQTSVMLTHSGAKFLSILLNKLVSSFEEATGTDINVDEARLARLEKALADVKSSSLAESEAEQKQSKSLTNRKSSRQKT